jgi:hypothetical protein
VKNDIYVPVKKGTPARKPLDLPRRKAVSSVSNEARKNKQEFKLLD